MWPNPNLVTFTEEIPNGKLHFLCSVRCAIWYHLHNFKNVKNTWSVTFSKVAGYKVTLLHGCFSHFSNCTNGTKSRKTPHMEICSSLFRTLKVLETLTIFYFSWLKSFYLVELLTRKHLEICQRFPVFLQPKFVSISGIL